MKKLKDSFSFTRTERIALLSMCCILFLCLALRFMIRFRSQSPTITDDTSALARSWASFEMAQQKRKSNISPATLFCFDPNTLDSSGFIQLGLPPRTVHSLLNWRRKGKIFSRKEAFSELYTLSRDQYLTLEPYIRIADAYRNAPVYPTKNRYEPQKPLPAVMDLNTVDSVSLVRLDGIGPALAHRIIERRSRLGSFLNHAQLREIYPFDDTTFAMMQRRLQLFPATARKINLNTVTIVALERHPYIGKQMAARIIQLRDGLGRFDKVQQLRQVPLMNEENYRKIATYFTTE